jgi:hypothetical protein
MHDDGRIGYSFFMGEFDLANVDGEYDDDGDVTVMTSDRMDHTCPRYNDAHSSGLI